METEIAILVGRRISPHANIMRGVHSFEVTPGDGLPETLRCVVCSGTSTVSGYNIFLSQAWRISHEQ